MNNISTERLTIRRFTENDYQDLYEYLSDKEVIKYEPYDAYTFEQAKDEVKYRVTDNAFYAICLKETNKLIGNLYFCKGDFDTWELGYVFNKNYQGQGYAFEGAKALLDYAFKDLCARRVVAMCNPLNKASWRLLERLKFRREGHLLKNIYFKKDINDEPIWQDTYEYAILSDEWFEN